MTLETTTTGQQTLAIVRHTGMAQAAPADVTTAIQAWVAGLGVAMQGAEYIVDTPACPDSFWPLPPDVKTWNIPGKNPKLRLPNESDDSYMARRRIATQTVGYVVRYGLGLGLAPEVALNGIFVIGGRPSMYAEQMVALVKSHGHGHRVIERTAEACVVEVRHRDDDTWETFEFTMDDAVRAGYVPGAGPNEGKDQWGKERKGGNAKYLTDPKAMLCARASSIACKIKFPETLRGMTTYEEVQDDRYQDQDDERVVPAPTTAAAIRARIQEIATPEAMTSALANAVADVEHGSVTSDAVNKLADDVDQAPEPAAEPAPEPPAVAGPEPLSPRTWAQINARFVELEVIGQGQQAGRLAVISHILGHPIARGSEMTAEEGRTVLDNLSMETVDEALGRPNPGRPDPDTDAARPAASVAGDAGEYDPTLEPGWGQHMDGGDADGEA